MTPDESVAQTTAPGPLTELVAHLATRLGDGDAARAVASTGDGPWPERLGAALAAVGVRARFGQGPVEDAAALARPDLPVVTLDDAGTWWMLDGAGLGHVRATPIADPRGSRWYRPVELARRIGAAPRPWAMVEPALPASPLAPGRPVSPSARLLALIRLERADVAVIATYAVAVGLLSLATPLAIQILINWLAFGGLLQPVIVLGFGLLVCLALAASLGVLQRVAVEALERRLFVRMVADLAVRFSRVQVQALDGADGRELANRFFDVLTLQKAAGTLLLDGIGAALQVAVAVAVLALYHPWLLVFDLILLAGMGLVIWPLGRGAQHTAIYESKAKYAVASWIEEVARHPLGLRLGGGGLAEAEADRLARYWLDRRADHFRVFLRQITGAQAFQVLASTVLLVACGSLVLEGELTLGQLVAAEFIVAAALTGFGKFTDKFDTVYDLIAGVDKLGTLLDLPPERPVGLPATQRPGPASVALEGVGARGLPSLSLELPAGSRTAVLGGPGSGKSTFAELAVGARVPDAGVVRHDGVPATLLRPDARYRDLLLLAPDALWSATVRDNVSLGRELPDVTIWEALGAVGLADRIRALPDGLYERVGPRGAHLSSLEIRQLLLARAMATRPRLLVCDGLLDGLGPAAGPLLDRLTSPDRRWTLLLFTNDPALADRVGRVHTLPGGPDGR